MKDKREHRVNVRMDANELEYLQARAKALGMTVSTYVRHVCLNAQVKTTYIG